jgi:hypothetical protein
MWKEVELKLSNIKRFLDEHGVSADSAVQSELYRADQGEQIYFADSGRRFGQAGRSVFFIRLKSKSGSTVSLRADTVVLGSQSLKAYDFFKTGPKSSWAVDVAQVECDDVLALKWRACMKVSDVILSKCFVGASNK